MGRDERDRVHTAGKGDMRATRWVERRKGGEWNRCEGNIYVDADKPFHLRQAHKISKVIASKIQLYLSRPDAKSISAWEYSKFVCAYARINV